MLAALALASVCAACVATEATVPARGVVVSGPPPAPLVEAQPASAPSARAAWVPGYWHWNGMQYAWIPGHWEENAPPGFAWAAPRYVKSDGAYLYEAGTWKPAQAATSAPAAAPTANALR